MSFLVADFLFFKILGIIIIIILVIFLKSVTLTFVIESHYEGLHGACR